MFVNISPAEYNIEETITTLVYGSRAKMITNDTHKNLESRLSARMNENFKKMQNSLELAMQTLTKNNIALPNELQESAPISHLEEIKEESEQDNPESKQAQLIDISMVPSENQ